MVHGRKVISTADGAGRPTTTFGGARHGFLKKAMPKTAQHGPRERQMPSRSLLQVVNELVRAEPPPLPFQVTVLKWCEEEREAQEPREIAIEAASATVEEKGNVRGQMM